MVFKSGLQWISVALLASAVRAQDSCSGTLNVTSQSDLDGISSCSSYNGDIHVYNSDAQQLSINGVSSIGGDLHVFNCTNLGTLQAGTLESINGTLTLESLTTLDTLSFPSLASVDSISFKVLPRLSELQFNHGVGDATDVVISDTNLESLDGLNLSSVSTFNINNNKNIQSISVDATSISDSLDISFNAEKVNVSLPNLEWAGNATFRFCSTINMPNLKNVSSLGLINNTLYGMEFAKLSTVTGDLEISSNSHLSNTSLSNLTTIGGGLTVANNSDLRSIDFPQLESVGGALTFIGNFSRVSVPKLDEVDGGVVIESSSQLNCSAFDSAHKNGDFHGDEYVCTGKQSDVSTALSASASGSNTIKSGSGGSGKGSSASATGSGSSSSSSNGAALVGGSSGLVSGLLVLLMEIV